MSIDAVQWSMIDELSGVNIGALVVVDDDGGVVSFDDGGVVLSGGVVAFDDGGVVCVVDSDGQSTREFNGGEVGARRG
jgi:hypothetical protein